MSIKIRLRLVEAGMLCVVALGAAAFVAFGPDPAVRWSMIGLLGAVAAGLAVVHLRLRQGVEAAAGLRRIGAGL